MNYRQKRLIYFLLLIMMVPSFVAFQNVQSMSSQQDTSYQPKMLSKLSSTNGSTPAVTYSKNYQVPVSFTNNGLTDAILLKFEFSSSTEIYVNASCMVQWSVTSSKPENVGGLGTWPTMDIPAGKYNTTYFLGTDYLLESNNPNVIVNGSINLTFKFAEKSDLTNIQVITFPEMKFSLNTSKISNLINTGVLLSPVQQMFLNRMTTNSEYTWNYNQSNARPFISELGNKIGNGGNKIPNGTIALVADNYCNSFSCGRFTYSENKSFTTEDVPIGYPFSFLKLPSALTLKEYELIFNDMFIYRYGSPKLEFTNNKGILQTKVSIMSPTTNESTIFQYNQSTGILLYYKSNTEDEVTRNGKPIGLLKSYEELSLEGYTYTSINSKSTPFNGLFSIIGLVTVSLLVAKKKKRT